MPNRPDLDPNASPEALQFLRDYRENQYARPSVAVDIVILTVVDTELKVLLVRRAEHPFRDMWALPGGFLRVGDMYDDQGEDLDDAAFRILAAKTGLDPAVLRNNKVHLEQVYTFGKANRDPRTRVLSVAHVALVPPQLVPLVHPGSASAEVTWFLVSDLPAVMGFDHGVILEKAVERVRSKVDYTNIAFSLVPLTFTVSEIRETFEAVKGDTFDLGNFRRKFNRMVTDGIIGEAPGKRVGRSGPPARVYRFRA